MLPKRTAAIEKLIDERNVEESLNALCQVIEDFNHLTAAETFLAATDSLDEKTQYWADDQIRSCLIDRIWQDYKDKASFLLVKAGKTPGVHFSFMDEEMALDDESRDIVEKDAEVSAILKALSIIGDVFTGEVDVEAGDEPIAIDKEVATEFLTKLGVAVEERLLSITLPQLNWYLFHIIEGLKFNLGNNISETVTVMFGETFLINLYNMPIQENLYWVEDIVKAGGGNSKDAKVGKNGEITMSSRGICILGSIFKEPMMAFKASNQDVVNSH